MVLVSPSVCLCSRSTLTPESPTAASGVRRAVKDAIALEERRRDGQRPTLAGQSRVVKQHHQHLGYGPGRWARAPECIACRPPCRSSATRSPQLASTPRRPSPRPSVQYATPRPESCCGAIPPRRPSRRLYIQISSPVVASSAIAVRRVPAVVYSTPPIMRGVPSSLYSGDAPRLSVLKVQASSRSLKLEASIWSRGEYRLLHWSAA